MTYQETIGGADAAHELPRVRSISPRDLWDALAKGFADFWAMPTHVIFLTIIYPIAGLVIGYAAFGVQPAAAVLSDGGGLRAARPVHRRSASMS